ncbi:Uncharacterized protein DAT39_001863, partial [Clarias magur]
GQSAAALSILHLAQPCHALDKLSQLCSKATQAPRGQTVEGWAAAWGRPRVRPLTPLNEHIQSLHHRDEGNAAGSD